MKKIFNYIFLYRDKKTWINFIIMLAIVFVSLSVHSVSAENMTITIPFGAGNPNFDTPTQEWFLPSVMTIHSGDTITWINNDTEIHNIVSGKGITRFQFVTTNNLGKSDGLFSSDSVKPGKSWSYTFSNPGTYHYFCSIHPWMNGAIVVNQQIPQDPTDGAGNPITTWPVVEYTLDRQYEVDFSWEPHVILTDEKTTFIFQFYDSAGRAILRSIPYDFAIVQNGNEIFRTSSHTTSIGGDYKSFVFKNPGTATFMLESIDGKEFSTEYSTPVYQNPNETSANIPIIEPARNLALGQEFAFIFVAPPIAIVVVMMLWWSGIFSRMHKKEKVLQPKAKRSAV